jgi:hypothetical protein
MLGASDGALFMLSTSGYVVGRWMPWEQTYGAVVVWDGSFKRQGEYLRPIQEANWSNQDNHECEEIVEI